jgi:hypothetical protein
MAMMHMKQALGKPFGGGDGVESHLSSSLGILVLSEIKGEMMKVS